MKAKWQRYIDYQIPHIVEYSPKTLVAPNLFAYVLKYQKRKSARGQLCDMGELNLIVTERENLSEWDKTDGKNGISIVFKFYNGIECDCWNNLETKFTEPTTWPMYKLNVRSAILNKKREKEENYRPNKFLQFDLCDFFCVCVLFVKKSI